MSGTLNKVMLIGHTGDDVKMHYFEGGGCMGRFPLATNETYTNRNTNERISNTEWHNIVVRNKAAEICEKYLKKGDMIYIEGRIKTNKWTDANGIDRYSTEVHCNEFKFLSPKDTSGMMEYKSSESSNSAKTPVKNTGNDDTTSTAGDPDTDDLPF